MSKLVKGCGCQEFAFPNPSDERHRTTGDAAEQGCRVQKVQTKYKSGQGPAWPGPRSSSSSYTIRTLCTRAAAAAAAAVASSHTFIASDNSYIQPDNVCFIRLAGFS